MKSRVLLVLTLLLLTASQIVPQQQQPPAPVPVGNLNLQNASLTEVVDQLARLLRLNIMIDPKVQGSVSLNTYGQPGNIDARNLLDLILRVNNAGLVQEGEIYRVVPINELVRQPFSQSADSNAIPEDDRTMLNLIFLKYVTVEEVEKVLSEFTDERTIIRAYKPANLLFIMDSRRNMRRLMDLIALFDSDAFAGERIRIFDIQNTLPSELLKDLESVLKSISLDNNTSTVRFLPVDRIGKLIAVAPNPGVFERVEQWIKTLDVAITETSSLIDTYVYRVNYGRADCLAMALNQLYYPQGMYGGYGGYGGYGMNGGYGFPGGGMYGGVGGGAYGGYPGGGFGGGGYGSTGFGAVGGNSTYGNQNAFSGGFGGAGACGPYSAMGMGGGMGMAGGYGYPTFGGYAAQTAIVPGQAVAAGGLVGASAPTQPGQPQATGQAATAMAAATQDGPTPPRIVANPLDNSLLIQGNAQQYQSILKLLRELDRAPRQILLEAKIYEVIMSGNFSAGVSASFQQRNGQDRRLVGNLVGNLTQLQAGVLVGQARQLMGFLELRENASNVRNISSPSLIATDSIPAVINVGAQVPVLTGTISSIGSTNPVTQQGISARNTGVTLQVNARVNPSGIVTLIVNQEVSAQAGTPSSAIPTPTFNQRVVQTQITLQDGDTIAIGGIVNEDATNTSQGVPGLNKIPYVGAVFGNQSRSRARTELVLFMTPHVIYDHNDLLEASEQVKNSMRRARKYFVQ